MHERDLSRADLAFLDQIDRRELIEQLYVLAEGKLKMYEERFDMDGWPPGEAEQNAEVLAECFDRGGWFHGVFDGEILVALVALDNVLLQTDRPALQLKFLHVSRDYRGQGIASRLFRLACRHASAMGAQEIHVSATPSRNTVDFYLRLGCTLLERPDPELLRLEPEDIHLCHRLG